MVIRKNLWLFLLILLTIFLVAGDEASAIGIDAFGAKSDDAGDDANAFRRALQSEANEIRVSKGKYILRDIRPYLPIRSNKTIICEAGAVFWVPEDAQIASKMTRQNYIFQPVFGAGEQDKLVNNFSMHGCKFVVELKNTTPILIDREKSKQITIENIVVDGKGKKSENQAAYGILVNGGIDLSIRNADIAYTRSTAIVVRLPQKCSIENNRISHAGVNASYPKNMPEKGRYGVDYWNSAGIGAPGASGCKITNNILDWTGGTGIILRGGVNNCENNVISFNKLTNIGKAAIGIGIFNGGKGSSSNNTVEGNVISGYMQRFSDSAINVNHRGPSGQISGINIINNYIDLYNPVSGKHRVATRQKLLNTYSAQVFIDPSSSGYVNHVTISNNEFRNATGPAISVKRIRNSEISSNTIYGSSRGMGESGLLAQWIPGRYLIVVNDALNLKVRGNKIVSRVEAAMKITASGSEVSNNLMIDCKKNDSAKSVTRIFNIETQKGMMKNVVFGNKIRKSMTNELCP